MSPRSYARTGLAAALAACLAACVANPPLPPPTSVAPRYPDYPAPDVPAALQASAATRDAQALAWRRLQAGDLRGADRDFTAILRREPAFYPAQAGLGFVRLAERQYKQAADRFAAALAGNERYLPAWQGQADAQLGLGDQAGAIASMQRMLVIDPGQDAVRNRLDLVQFRQIQTLIDAGRKARSAGRLDDAQTDFESALRLSPSSAVIFQELADTETARGALTAAEAHARQATELDPRDAAAFGALGAALEAQGRYLEASAAYGRAARLDPRPAWKTKSTSLRDKADMAAIPAEYRALPTAQTVTRAQVAALIGIRLSGVLDEAEKRVTPVATDIRGHWAEPWIVPVTQAGVMDVYPNHTFQPSAPLRRSDLAQVLTHLLTVVSAEGRTDLSAWKAARPHFTDLPPGNVFYPAAALAVACGAMTVEDGGRFAPTQPATGPDVVAAIARIERIAGR
jgi:tetratricopeptide (TPR) repeat protein